MAGLSPSALLLVAFSALLVIAALKDLTTMTIPNWVSGVLLVLFLPAAFAVGLPLEQIGWHGLIGLGMLALGVGMFALNWMGGGDAKLLSAAGLYFGWPGAMEFVLWTCMAGGALALVLLSARSYVRPLVATGKAAWVDRLLEPKGDIPYGVAIAVGALAAFPESGLMKAFQGTF